MNFQVTGAGELIWQTGLSTKLKMTKFTLSNAEHTTGSKFLFLDKYFCQALVYIHDSDFCGQGNGADIQRNKKQETSAGNSKFRPKKTQDDLCRKNRGRPADSARKPA